MSIFVSWSGGYDSTLLLYQESTRAINENIIAITVNNISGGQPQKTAESKARERLKKKLPKNITYCEVGLDQKNLDWANSWQMPFWVAILPVYLKDGDTLMMSYLSSDGYDFWVGKQKMEKCFDSFCDLMDKKCKLEFPLQTWTKGNVIRDLKKIKLLKDCSYCGKPEKGKPCGKCMKCKSVQRWSKFPESGDAV